jgi:hypothetical protein
MNDADPPPDPELPSAADPVPEAIAPAPDSSDDDFNPFNIQYSETSDDSEASFDPNQMQCARCGVTAPPDDFDYVSYYIDHPNVDCLEEDRDFCQHCSEIVRNTPGETGNYCDDDPDCVDCAEARAEDPLLAPAAEAALEAGNQEPAPAPAPELASAPALVQAVAVSEVVQAERLPLTAWVEDTPMTETDEDRANREQWTKGSIGTANTIQKYMTSLLKLWHGIILGV